MNGENKRREILHEMQKGLTQKNVTENSQRLPEPIAIIGLSGTFPQSKNVHEFWDALDNDRSLMEEIPQSRIDWTNIFDPTGKDPDKSHSKWGGMIPGIRDFDPGFFGILPAEASLMDPRKRLLLMSVYHALEDAGYAPGSQKGSMTGVFVAVEEDEYCQYLQAAALHDKPLNIHSSSLIANQLSYFFDFRGPSEVVNTMCSGAAVAIHRAVCALRAGEISLAVVGAANLMLTAEPFVFLSGSGQMSPDHSVRSFGKNANGFLRADGLASMILKPLSKAVEDKDAIYAVIKNTAVNYNGQGGMSMAAPNISSHAELIRTCYEQVHINPKNLGYIEAQGMGNPVADLAEWEAFNRALKTMAEKQKVSLDKGACRVSTVKPMTGHMHAASAMGALFKIIRSLQTNKIHPILGFKDINPDLDLEDQPCRLVIETEDWMAEESPRLAGLHSYGSGGNNAHILIEEYKGPLSQKKSGFPVEKYVFPFSAATEKQCKLVVQNLLDFVSKHPDLPLPSIAYTLQTGRDSMKHRVSFVAASLSDLIGQAQAYLDGKPAHNHPDMGLLNDPAPRIHLPGYPFDCQEYWIGKEGKNLPPPVTSSAVTIPPDFLPAAETIVRNILHFFLQKSPESIDLTEEFSSMGFDSLLVRNLTHRLFQQYDLRLEPAILFEHTTPAQLIHYIGNTFRDRLTNGTSKKETPNTQTNSLPPSPSGSVREDKDEIAIIGLAGSFPQSPDMEQFWKNILSGIDCIEEIPGDRWAIDKHFHPDKEIANKSGKSYGKWGGFVKDLYHFDPLFFNISPSEAGTMNPKERLFLQCSWHVMEDAGYTPQTLSHEQVGVFVGVTRSGLDPYKVSMFPIANRASYLFNFRGPSMPIDTACSSSLVAIHEACQHIHAGECTVAIAGGVHAFLDPSHFAALSGLYMLSPEGLSRSFGDEANGMVPGEGVGAIMLKPLKKAIADRDNIYGIIRGSSTNHGGKANGFTVPNPKAHTELIRNALHKANVNARMINYVEAHGTGTSLGDPIEIRGLSEAFKKDSPDTQYCPIGSIKSNIGHLEAAAGISGLAKILLQMKHGRLAPSLHAKKLNPQIDFSQTPFLVQQQAADWNPLGKDGTPIARTACLSSFGAGGSNAHLIIGEFQKGTAPLPAYGSDGKPAIILLSAKSNDQLDIRVKQLLSFLETVEYYNGLLENIAYTLQVGREAMEQRLAMEVLSLDDLKDKLTRFINRSGNIEKLWSGNAASHKETVLLFSGDTEMEKVTEGWALSKNFGKLLNLWTKGYHFDWRKLYLLQNEAGFLPHRISLPLYPFLKEYYGLPAAPNGDTAPAALHNAPIHPLIHTNVSTFSGQRFSSTFNGLEPFLKDHVIKGEKFLPGVAYLEMIHAAAGLASDNAAAVNDELEIHIKDVVWIQPVIAGSQPVKLDIRLTPNDEGEVLVGIYSAEKNTPGDNDSIHCQGTARFTEKSNAPSLDIDSLKAGHWKSSLSSDQCYRIFDKMGISYGPSHRSIEQLFAGDGRALARLRIPAGLSGTLDQFCLHPGIMDAAFQSIMGLMASEAANSEEPLPLAVPFTLKDLMIFGRCTENMWALIRPSDGLTQTTAPGNVNDLSFDIDLCDDAGKIRALVKGFISRTLPKRAEFPANDGLLFLQPSWDIAPVAASAEKILYDEHLVLCSDDLIPAGAAPDGVRFVRLPTPGSSTEERLINYTLLVFNEVKKLLSARPKGKMLVQVLLAAGPDQKTLSSIAGLLKTARLENPKFLGQTIMLDPDAGFDDIAAIIEQDCHYDVQQIHYSNGQRKVFSFREHIPGNDSPIPWKDGAVYLITGGGGGLGIALAKEIASRSKDATLVLTGRSELNEAKMAILESLRSLGARLVYHRADITDKKAMEDLVQLVLLDHGRLDTVIHCAGLIADSFIIKKSENEIRDVLAPKILGLVNLDLATAHLPLDRFIIFSSVAALTGNTGQADYAVANAFMDEFAWLRQTMVSSGERKGSTVSINWPLWKDGGMQVGEEIERIMWNSFGMHPLETDTGIRALYEILAAGPQQMMVVAGNGRLLRNTFLNHPPAHSPAKEKDSAGSKKNPVASDGLKEKAILYFKKLLSGVLTLSTDRIDANAPLEQYGIDSIMVMRMTAELEKVFGTLQKTLFFEYQSISELTGYFLEFHADKLPALLDYAEAPPAEVERKVPQKAVSRFAPIAVRPVEKKREDPAADIAIIGLSGRYPQAKNLQEFWDNLYNGRNCITEIPRDRWDHSLYFDTDKSKAWKTNSRWGGFLDGVDEFDPLFFNISPREAEILDPQERLFLQCAYGAMEDAGYTRQLLGNGAVQSKVGVYVGVMWNEYQLHAAQEIALGRPMAVSSNLASIANRVSYYCNFNGPSIGLDTMCSSSLTAIHLACQSLQLGECKVAIAGGVNISIHPNKYLVLGYGNLASSKGLCESFGAEGDGYVPSEGVGAVLLKPLSQAIADRDHIYGVIKGSAINHGGKVNGYSVPNPKAQAKVISQVLSASGLDPRTLSYVEAHGTGTALGDPIEIAGLTAGFKTSDKQFCAIGSVKSNIGHCEGAAGIAGVTKVLLQMQHRLLVPSLHSRSLNPNIDFANSPFVVQQELTEWKRPVLNLNGHAKEYPRRAGVSSFGAGGANAHILIEEYIPALTEPAARHPVAILLSARNEDRLKERARQLLSAIKAPAFADSDLQNMAYTLQVGREAMEERLAFEVSSIKQLEEKLAGFIRGDKTIDNIYVGKDKSHKEILSLFSSDEDMEKIIENWLSKKKYSKLLGLWTTGFDIDWEQLYAGAGHSGPLPQRISLPSYPFMRKRYWPDTSTGIPASGNGSSAPSIMHPLVHHNTSTFAEQKFSSTFTGEEFFLKDHLVNGEKLLPGVAYLEMINESMGIAGGQKTLGIQLENMVWAQPLMVNGHPEKVHIGLTPHDNGEVRFEICSRRENGEMNPVTHSQGTARYTRKDANPVVDVLDIEALKSLTNRPVIDADECYRLFSRMGIAYGPAQRGIEAIYVGDHQVLAKLGLPPVVADTLDQYYLHPSLMDASLQAVIGFWARQYPSDEDLPLAIPFAIRSLEIIGRCTPEMWAYIRYSAGQGAAAKSQDIGQLSFDIDVCDLSGNICIRIEGFTSRVIRKEARTPEMPQTLLIEPYWAIKDITPAHQPISFSRHLVILLGNNDIAETLSRLLPGAELKALHTPFPSIAAGFEDYAIQVFREVKSLFETRLKNKVLVQVIVPSDNEPFSAIAGLLKTAAFENPLFTGQVIAIGHGETASGIASRLKDNSLSPYDSMISYRNGHREVAGLREYTAAGNAEHIWKDGSLYLVTGGAGGLGMIFLKEIAGKVKNATVILVGRSPLNREREMELNEIRSSGTRVAYRQTDIADEKVVADLVQNILQEFGQLNGIIHCAGVLRDHFILNKSEDEVREVFAPKVKGMFNLDMAASGIPLDFFIVCSSSTGITGNTGQADYAMANAFMDRLTSYRNKLVRAGQRSGKTLSVNWPLWKDGGMHVTPDNEARLMENYGMVPLETAPALHALYLAMAADTEQIMVLQGKTAKLRATFLEEDPGVKPPPPPTPPPTAEPVSGKSEGVAYLKKILSGVIKLPADQINADKPMEEYGIDSVMVMQMTNELEKVFGSLSKTLFFEYQNIRELSDHLFDRFPEKFSSLLEKKSPPPAANNPAPPSLQPVRERTAAPIPANTLPLPKPANRFAETTGKPPERNIDGPLDIAIVGLAGRYPQARNLQEFWQVLQNGKNCITEIPKSRWDHEPYFDKERNKLGKSYGKWGGFLEGPDEFDPLFFGISAREAEGLDPQERLFLQCAYETLEDAGYTRGTIGQSKDKGIAGNVGVYVGVMWNEYQLYGAQETALGRPLTLAGVSASIANRVSYFCNFNGLSITLNTMCSSSLTAIHLACQSIRQGECEAAIAGGVNLSLHPNKYMALGYGNYLSSKGLCESFGADADGYVPGEGVGAVLLKPLARALEDNDHIYGVIKGSAVNHGGKTNSYTVPNPKAQTNVINKAMKMAAFDPETISYLEAQGTGTSLGDSIEITGLNKAFGTKNSPFCPIGSVKSNIGHCESASGIAALTKVLLQMKYRQLVPSLHSKLLNPNIEFKDSCFFVQQDLVEWKRPVLESETGRKEYPRRAGVSAFGAGGSNAHLLIEEFSPADDRTGSTAPQTPALIILSARNETQLRQKAGRLLHWMKELDLPSPALLLDLAYTLQVGREEMKERLAMEVSSFQQLEQNLAKYINGEIPEGLFLGQVANTTEQPLYADLAERNTAEAWVNGMNIDWRLRYSQPIAGTFRPRRISLPTYPFASEKYWIPQTDILPAPPAPVITQAVAAPPPPKPVPKPQLDDPSPLLEKVRLRLKVLFAGIVKYNLHQIDDSEPFTSYGIDSIMTQMLNAQLAGIYGDLSSTLLYDYPSLDSLARCLVNDFPKQSKEWAGPDSGL